MHAYSRSISTIWLVNTSISAFGLFLVLFIRGYTLKRTIIRGGEKKVEDMEMNVEGDPRVLELESLEDEKRPATRDDASEHTRADSADDTGGEKTEA
jgi:hypothetical protein